MIYAKSAIGHRSIAKRMQALFRRGDARGIFLKFALAMSAALAVVVPPEAVSNTVNQRVDPDYPYGCSLPVQYRGKMGHVVEVGESLADITAIEVLVCSKAGGPAGTSIVSCPPAPGNPYAYCLENQDDGVGNRVELGVVKLNSVNDPNGRYGCGAGTNIKARLVDQVHNNRAFVNNIMVIECRPADGPGGAAVVECPPKPHPYSYCLESSDDGAGNHVKLGVVASTDGSDPYAQYGKCGVRANYRAKSGHVTAAGRSLENVRGIDILSCTTASGTGGTFVVPCPAGLSYSYCLRNQSDGVGNDIFLGVMEAP